MDLSRLIGEPPLGEVERAQGRPLEETVDDVVPELSEELPSVRDQFNQVVHLMLEVLDDARLDFEESVSDDVLDDVIEPLVDASTLTDEQYERFVQFMHREVASSVLRSFVIHVGEPFGVQYSPPKERRRDTVRSAFTRFVGEIEASMMSVGQFAMDEVLVRFISDGYRAMYDVWMEQKRGQWGDDLYDETSKEGKLARRIRELESTIVDVESRARSWGAAYGELDPPNARELSRLVADLISLLDSVINGLDMFLAVAAVNIRVDLNRWGKNLLVRIEDRAREESARLMQSFSSIVIHPLLDRLRRVKRRAELLERVVGEIRELESLEQVFNKVDEWMDSYERYIRSLRDRVNTSRENCFKTVQDTKRYASLRRYRKLCSLIRRVLMALNDGIAEGLRS